MAQRKPEHVGPRKKGVGIAMSAVVVDITVSIDGGSTEGEDTHRPSKKDFYRVEKHTHRRQLVTLLQRRS